MSADVYAFRSGARINREQMRRAREAAYSAAACLSIAEAFEGHSDQRRDDAIDDALTNLSLSLKALEAALPRPSFETLDPAAVRRADLTATMFDIAGVTP